jgi:quercetin dioxygenase-like cupin family protein
MKLHIGSIAIVAALSFGLGALYSHSGESSDILFENDRVRVRRVILEPGVHHPEHTHELPHVGVIVKPGALEFHEGGEIEIVEFQAGDAGWREAGVTHSIVNRSDTPVHVVEVELKD